jgi:hypothetical protein
MGFDRPQPILADASGGGLAAPVWGRVMADYYRRRPAPVAWVPPPDLQAREIDRRSGKLATPGCPRADVTTEYFLAGTEPTESCPLHLDGVGGESWLGQAVHAVGNLFGNGTGDDGQQEPAAPPPPRAKPVKPYQPVPVPGAH